MSDARDYKPLSPDELEEVLGRAKAEGWTELALIGRSTDPVRLESLLLQERWNSGYIFFLSQPLETVPAALLKLTRLTKLVLGGIGIGVNFAEALARASHLSSLIALNLRGNEIGDEGAETLASAAHLANLTALDLGYNRIGEKGAAALAGAAHLAQLTALDLAYNDIGEKGTAALAGAGHLSRLTTLNLWNNGIGDEGAAALAGAVHLAGLTTLDLRGNRIGAEGTAALAGAVHLTMLTTLSLSDNRIGEEGAAALARAEHLAGLTALNLGGNDIAAEGAAALAGAVHLSGLTTLDLWVNGIGDEGAAALAGSVHLSNLETLDLVGNEIPGLPEELLQSRDAQAIFRHVRAEGKQPLLAARVVVLGEGKAGKTHVRERLLNDPFYYEARHLSTHNIEMRPWSIVAPPTVGAKPEKVAIRLWDFGGQPHLHASHRFFISHERNLYVLVLDATKSAQENLLEYRLGLIRREAKEAPVVVLVTKCDEPGCGAAGRPLGGIDESQLKERWPNVVKVVDGYGWSKRFERDDTPAAERATVRRRHQDAHANLVAATGEAIARVKGVSDGYPPGFFGAMKWLEKTFSSGQAAHKYVTRRAYRKVCIESGLSAEQADDYLPVFRNLGLCHWVGDRTDVRGRMELEDLLFNPAWVKGPIYTLIRGDEHDRGVMTLAQVEAVLPAHDGTVVGPEFVLEDPSVEDDYPLWKDLPFSNEDRRRILNLMRVCGLCFDLARGDGILVPDLLPSRAMQRWKKLAGADVLHGEGTVVFLHEDALMRFLGEWYDRIDDPPTEMWRDEVTVRRDGCIAVLQADINARRLIVQIKGETVGARERMATQIEEALERVVSPRGSRCDDESHGYARQAGREEKAIEWDWQPPLGTGEDGARLPKRRNSKLIRDKLLIDALARELKQHLKDEKKRLHETERTGRTFEPAPLTQTVLAQRCYTSASTVTRLVKNPNPLIREMFRKLLDQQKDTEEIRNL